MKKSLLWVVVLVLGISMITAFSLSGCKVKEAVVEAVVEEEAVEEAPAEEVTEDRTLTVWSHTVGEGFPANIKLFEYAAEVMEEKYPNVTVEIEGKSFEQMQKTAKMVLNSDDTPDVMESNTGSATVGTYYKEGLVYDISDIAHERGWDEIMPKSFQESLTYDENGKMGVGKLAGVNYFGEYVLVYYNKDMFEQYGLEVPTSLAEFEAVCDKFVAEGIIPITVGGLDQWPFFHDWWEMVLYKMDAETLKNYFTMEEDVDFQGEAFTFGAEKMREYYEESYFDPNINGISYVDSNTAFAQGLYPLNLTGTWIWSTYLDTAMDHEWGSFIMPGKLFTTGASGAIVIVPENAKNKDLAIEYLDILLSKDAQIIFSNNGGISCNVDLNEIEDEKNYELNTGMAAVLENGFGFYPDWAVPGMMDVLGASLQDLVIGNITPEQFNTVISKTYYDYKLSMQ